MRTLLFCGILLITSTGYCSDLEIVNCSVFLTKTEGREVNVKKEEEWKREKRKFFTYRVVFYLKNISDKEVSVATRGLSVASSISHEKENFEMQLDHTASRVNGMTVIPPAGDFGIVNLKPGECAMVRFQDTSTQTADEVTIAYGPRDPYEGRLGYWTGMVRSPAVKIQDVRGSWTEWDPQNSHWIQPGY